MASRNTQPARPIPTRAPGVPSAALRIDIAIGAAVVLAAIAVFANTIRGDFVYDDARQIVGNALIQDGQYFGKAMLSDVWAFKGSAGGRVSNYWRPSFVLWLMANVRAFGLESTVGWHVGNILLHALTTGLAFALLRRLGLSAAVAGAIGVLFAVHPVHVETVAWISGSPDLILAPALLGSLWFVLNTVARPTVLNWAAAIGLYVVAQGAKEVGIFYGVIAMLAVVAFQGGTDRSAQQSAARGAAPRNTGVYRAAALRAAPFVAIAAGYLACRAMVLGPAPVQGKPPVSWWVIDLLSAPRVGAFYLRQMVFPVSIGPSYPIRPVLPATATVMSVVAPALVCLAVGGWMVREAVQRRVAALGLAVLVLPLAPAMHVSDFRPEQVVHDRYLYLPLLGFLMVVVPAVSRLRSWWGVRNPTHNQGTARGGRFGVLVGAAACAVPLAAQTIRSNKAWRSEMALWRSGVATDPISVLNAVQLAVHLRQAAMAAKPKPDEATLDEARREAERAIRLIQDDPPGPGRLPRPELPNALLIRADVAIDQGRYGDAEADLRGVLAALASEPPVYEVFQAYERLAVCFERQRRMAEAQSLLREGLLRLPQHKAALTHLLAVVLYMSDQKAEALRELEAVRPSVAREFSSPSRMVLFDLGRLYVELGKKPEAVGALREFLALTAGARDEELRASRELSVKLLRQLGG